MKTAQVNYAAEVAISKINDEFLLYMSKTLEKRRKNTEMEIELVNKEIKKRGL